MDPLQILVVEDDPKVAQTVSASLRENGFHVFRCGNGSDALSTFESERVDIMVLDLGLPDVDGMDILRRVRTQSPGLPVLILTARDAVADRIAGLNAGADDYLVKPFSLAELLARLRALSRRVEIGRQSVVKYKDLVLDIAARTVSRAGEELAITPREFDLLLYLLDHQGEVVTRSMLSRDVWKYHSRATPIDNIIDVQMSRLREKVDKPYKGALINTVRGVGFTMGDPP